MRMPITVLGLLLAAGALSAQQSDAGGAAAADNAKASLALPDKERDLTTRDQTVTVVFGAVGLVAAMTAAPYVIAYGGEARIGPFKTPYWALDAAGALIAIAALNYTFNEIYHVNPDRSLFSIFGVAIGKF